MERAAHCINLCLTLLQSTTRAVVHGLLSLLDSAISQLMDGTRDDWGVEMAKQLEKSWKSNLNFLKLTCRSIRCYFRRKF
jgi:hypothetical protein